MTVLFGFIYYFCIGVILYPFVKKLLDTAAEEAVKDDEKIIDSTIFKKFVFILFILFWPAWMAIILKDSFR